MFCKHLVRAKKPKQLINLSLLVLVVFSCQSKAQINLQEVQSLVQRWVAIEQQNSALISDWKNQRTMLEQRQALLIDEKAQLQTILDDSSTDTDSVEKERISLLEMQNTMEQDQNLLLSSLQTALGSLRSLQAQLPPPLKQSWEDKFKNLEAQKNVDTQVSNSAQNNLVSEDNVSQSLQVVLELLTELDDFQNRISTHEAPVTLADKSSVMVKQLYLGASHGWFVSADGLISAYGHSTPAGWEWLEDLSVDGKTVLAAIAMLERNVDVALIELPVILPAPPPSMSFDSVAQTSPLNGESN